MPKQATIPPPRSARIERELKTVAAMIDRYCRDKHHSGGAGLCAECRRLAEYAKKRLAACPFQADKPTCAKCPVHCYKLEMRERIKEVMRYSGPRMLLYHPLLALAHLLDEKLKKTPQPKTVKPKPCPSRRPGDRQP